MKIFTLFWLLTTCAGIAACSSVQNTRGSTASEIDASAPLPASDIQQSARDAHPEARVYDASADAAAEVDVALARAAENDKKVILAMGANWCHDSRGFAGWMATPRFSEMIASKYEVVYIDVGTPQAGEGRNINIAQRFGIDEITGTPTVLVLSSSGELLNPDTAATWRNAASRSEDEIFSYFADLQ